MADDPSSSDPPAAVDEKVPNERNNIMNMFNYILLYVGQYFIHIWTTTMFNMLTRII